MCMPCVRVSGTKSPVSKRNAKAVGHSPKSVTTERLERLKKMKMKKSEKRTEVSKMPKKLARFYNWEEYV